MKSLFRPIALTAPDLQHIVSIELQSIGYANAHSLAVKITTLFRLCAQYLTAKAHLDFGIRAIKTILNVAKVTLASDQQVVGDDANDEMVVAKAICEYGVCKLDAFDLNVFQSIFNEIFPNQWTSNDATESTEMLLGAVGDACERNNVNGSDYFLLKIQQLYQLIRMTPGIILIGDAYSGKTTLYRTLANALALCGERNQLDEMRPQCKGMCVTEYGRRGRAQ